MLIYLFYIYICIHTYNYYYYYYFFFKATKLLTNFDDWVVYIFNFSQAQSYMLYGSNISAYLWHVDSVFGSGTVMCKSMFEQK